MSRAGHILTWTGGTALIATALLDSIGVAGRHLGLPLHGVIELVQAAILIAGSVALVAATAADSHAKVHLLVDRLSPTAKRWSGMASHLLSALLAAALLAGGLWLSADLWHGHEISELMGVPYKVLRIIANLSLFAVMALFLRHAVRSLKS